MIRILVVEDEKVIREGIAEFLLAQNYQVFLAKNGCEGLDIFQKETVDLIITDIMMPKMDGLKLLQEIRKFSKVPVLMLTALTDEKTQISSFDALADDYISKPFSLLILKKRIEALLRRAQTTLSMWTYQDTKVDFSGYKAWLYDKEVDIKPKEIKLLRLLLDHEGQVLTRQQILDNMWSYEEAPYDRVIDVYIKNLRKKLQLECIKTIKGVGYKIEREKI